MKAARQRRERETPLQIAVVNGLRYALPPGAIIHHSHNEGKRGGRDAAQAKAMGQLSGFADIMVLMAGRVYFIELKVKPNKQTTSQEVFQKNLAREGFPNYAVCYSWEDVLAAFASWGVRLRVVGNAALDRSKPFGL